MTTGMSVIVLVLPYLAALFSSKKESLHRMLASGSFESNKRVLAIPLRYFAVVFRSCSICGYHHVGMVPITLFSNSIKRSLNEGSSSPSAFSITFGLS